MTLTFEPFTEEYVEIYYQWAGKPYIRDIWFREGYEPKEKILEKINGSDSVPFVVKVGDTPVGYIQYYDLSKGCWKAMASEPEGTLGFDVFIGEEDYLEKGYGTVLVIAFTDMLFNLAGTQKVVVDPAPDNKRAIRCYEKAGFSFVRNAIDDMGEKIYIMAQTTPTNGKYQ